MWSRPAPPHFLGFSPPSVKMEGFPETPVPCESGPHPALERCPQPVFLGCWKQGGRGLWGPPSQATPDVSGVRVPCQSVPGHHALSTLVLVPRPPSQRRQPGGRLARGRRPGSCGLLEHVCPNRAPVSRQRVSMRLWVGTCHFRELLSIHCVSRVPGTQDLGHPRASLAPSERGPGPRTRRVKQARTAAASGGEGRARAAARAPTETRGKRSRAGPRHPIQSPGLHPHLPAPAGAPPPGGGGRGSCCLQCELQPPTGSGMMRPEAGRRGGGL